MRGASLRAVGELLGHQTMHMTMRYAHLSPGYLSAEIGLLDDVADGRGKKDANPRDRKRAKKGQRADTSVRPGSKIREFAEEFGAPSTTRTCDLLVRSQTLYPTELWARGEADPKPRV